MMMALSKEERTELVLLSGREGWSQTLCIFYHVPKIYRHPVVPLPNFLLQHKH